MSERSPPDSSDSRRTFLPDGRASISIPVLSTSSGSVRKTRPAPPGNKVANNTAKCSLTSWNAVWNTLTISRSTARITRNSSRRLSFTSSSCCWRNVWRSASASCSWSAKGLIGPNIRSSRSSSRARPASVVPSGTSGWGASRATAGSQSKSARSFSIAFSSRMRVSASSISARLSFSRVSAPSCSSPARSARRASRRSPDDRAASDWRRLRSRSRSWMASTSVSNAVRRCSTSR